MPDTRSGKIDIEPSMLDGLEKRGPISPISGRSFNSKTTSLRKLEGQFESMLEISLSS